MLIKGRFQKEIWLFFYLIFLFASTGVQAFVQEPDDDHPFGLTFDDETLQTPQDHEIKVEFTFEIPDRHYLYSEKMNVSLNDASVKAQVVLPEATKIFDAFSNVEKEVYYNSVVIPVTLILPPDYDADHIVGVFEYQGCSDTICFRSVSQDFSIPLNISSNINDGKSKDDAPSFFARLLSNDLDLAQESRFALYAMAFVLGVLSSLSVCVLPLVPLTIAFMGAGRAASSRGKSFGLLLLFLCGLVSMNAPLGAGAAWLGVTLGFQYQNPYFLVFVTLLFLFVGVWMLGVFHLQLPHRWQTTVSRWQPNGAMRAYVSGLTIGILSFACVGPFLLPLMTFVAGSGNFTLGISVMVAFSLGMSVLFVLAAFFSANWMRRFGGKSLVLKRLTGVLMLVFAGYFGWIFAKSYLLSPPEAQHAFFKNDFVAAKAEAQKSHKMLLVDFSAEWCLPCQRWEIEVWSKPELQTDVLQRFVPVQVDCTTDTPLCNELTQNFHVRGMPTILFLRPDGNEIAKSRLEGVVMSSDEFLDYLSKLQIDENSI